MIKYAIVRDNKIQGFKTSRKEIDKLHIRHINNEPVLRPIIVDKQPEYNPLIEKLQSKFKGSASKLIV